MSKIILLVALGLIASVYAAGPSTCTCNGTPSSCTIWTSSICTVAGLQTNFGATGVSGVSSTCTNGVAGSASCTAASFNGDCPDVNAAAAICATACGGIGASGTATYSCAQSSEKTCFPANSTVQLEDGSAKRMDALSVGDKVLAKPGEFSDVFMFSHKLSAVRAEFVRISTAGGRTVTLTGNHYLYVNGRMAVASIVKAGDELITATGAADKVTGVSTIWADGLYNPHTMHGDIVVDGIQTSTYTSDIEPTLAHAALWPVRMLYSMGKDVVGETFAEGSDLIASIMPDGKKKY